MKKLDELGFVWEKDDPWEKRFELARRYYAEHGDILVAANYTVEGVRLNKWLNEQKLIGEGRRGKTLTDEQRRKLESIGMVFGQSSIDRIWEERYSEAVRYYAEHKNLNISGSYIDSTGKRLDIWLKRQRSARRSGRLSERQISRLNELGFRW